MESIRNLTNDQLAEMLTKAEIGAILGSFNTPNSAPFYIWKKSNACYLFGVNFNDAPLMGTESAKDAVIALRFLDSVIGK